MECSTEIGGGHIIDPTSGFRFPELTMVWTEVERGTMSVVDVGLRFEKGRHSRVVSILSSEPLTVGCIREN